MATKNEKKPRRCPMCGGPAHFNDPTGMHTRCHILAITLQHMARDHREATARPQHLQTMREE